MKIALLGYGKMGKLIEQIAHQQGDEVIARFSRQYPLSTEKFSLDQADVCIDFSHPKLTLHHIQTCSNQKKPLIIGTTGWEKDLLLAQQLVEKSQIGCLYAPNFSFGINLFMQIVSHAAKLFSPFEEYDVGGMESHHRQKFDSPSGTAKALAEQVMAQIPRLDQLEFSSLRCGHIPGTHVIQFDGPVDSIILTHQARNREGFARGALKAAHWILNKQGFFTLEDLLEV